MDPSLLDPSTAAFWTWIDSHQPIVAALIVFVGVIVGLIGNGWLQRKDRNSKRDHDREATRLALLAELGHLRFSYETRVDMMKQAKGHFSVPVHVPTEVYDAMLDKVGLLKFAQCTAVIHAYLAAKHLPMNLRRIEAELLPVSLGKPEGDFVTISPANMAKAIKMHEDRVRLYKVAIAALENAPIESMKADIEALNSEVANLPFSVPTPPRVPQ